MAASITSASSAVTLFPAGSTRRPKRKKEQGVTGSGRATPGNRRRPTTTIVLSPIVEELLERLIERGVGDSNSDVARKAVIALAVDRFGADFVQQLETDLGKETPTA